MQINLIGKYFQSDRRLYRKDILPLPHICWQGENFHLYNTVTLKADCTRSSPSATFSFSFSTMFTSLLIFRCFFFVVSDIFFYFCRMFNFLPCMWLMKSSGSRLRGDGVNVGAAVVVFGLLAVAVAVVLTGGGGVRLVADSLWGGVLVPLWSELCARPLLTLARVAVIVVPLWLVVLLDRAFRRR
ncbi:MAG: hypothetical protein II999_04380 [Bacteroidaceae bacterium]|nr:hypothetical protein [Bacteroidaceae bacterium]